MGMSKVVRHLKEVSSQHQHHHSGVRD